MRTTKTGRSSDGEEPEEEATEEERESLREETWNRREIKDCPDLLQLVPALYTPKPNPAGPLSFEVPRAHLIFERFVLRATGLSVPVRHPEGETIRRGSRPIEVLRSDGIYKSTRPIPRGKPDVVEVISAVSGGVGEASPSHQ